MAITAVAVSSTDSAQEAHSPPRRVEPVAAGLVLLWRYFIHAHVLHVWANRLGLVTASDVMSFHFIALHFVSFRVAAVGPIGGLAVF
jgi:hypothetical protein